MKQGNVKLKITSCNLLQVYKKLKTLEYDQLKKTPGD